MVTDEKLRTRRPLPPPASPATGVGAGLLVAAAIAPGTFAPSLSARSAMDQGIITALSTGLHYVLTVGTQDALQAAAAELAEARPLRRLKDPVVRQRAITFAADMAAVPVGLAIQRALPRRPGEAMMRGLLRQAGWRLTVTGIGGGLLLASQAGARVLDGRVGGRGWIARFPVAIPVGLGVAFVLDRRRQAEPEPEAAGNDSSEKPSAARSMAIAGGVVGALTAVGYAEHLLASQLGRRLSSVLPGNQQVWKLAGDAATLGLVVAAGYTLFGRAMRKIETGASADQPVLEADEATRWTTPEVSGGPGSVVAWELLGREGRRHALTPVRPNTITNRPAGVPDLSIETVMGEPAKATPIQVYISLDSAGTMEERVDLALAEMERTGAFDRSLIMLVSPTGTGYVNYVAVAAAQYLTLGDMASVTMQYSKRPSPLSLGKVKDAREQNRLLWLRILERLNERSDKPRPRVVVFGESLGAHTSQDVFLHWGTVGPGAMGINRGLWIGTPYGSGWMHEITGPHRPDVDKNTVAVVNDFDQFQDLGGDRRSKVRYVLVSHDNDGVTKFGADLLTTAPSWLGPDRAAMQQAAPGASPRGIPATMRWRPITTFFQSVVDMKNAQIPGAYSAWAHDYRPDLARFIRDVFDLSASDEQMAAIENALEQRETIREQLFEPAAKQDAKAPA